MHVVSYYASSSKHTYSIWWYIEYNKYFFGEVIFQLRLVDDDDEMSKKNYQVIKMSKFFSLNAMCVRKESSNKINPKILSFYDIPIYKSIQFVKVVTHSHHLFSFHFFSTTCCVVFLSFSLTMRLKNEQTKKYPFRVLSCIKASTSLFVIFFMFCFQFTGP